MITKSGAILTLLAVSFLSSVPAPVAAQGLHDPDCESVYEGYVDDERLRSSVDDGHRLIGAAAGGDLSEISRLLKKRVDPNYSHLGLMTPLAWAARCGRLDAVKFLLKSGADVNFPVSFEVNSRFRHRNSSALIWAVANSHKGVVKYLLAQGADSRRQEKVYQLRLNSAGKEEEVFYGAGRRASDVAEDADILALLRKSRKWK